MSFAGLPKAQERADVIAFLNSKSDKPIEFPAPVAEGAATPADGGEGNPAAPGAADPAPAGGAAAKPAPGTTPPTGGAAAKPEGPGTTPPAGGPEKTTPAN